MTVASSGMVISSQAFFKHSFKLTSVVYCLLEIFYSKIDQRKQSRSFGLGKLCAQTSLPQEPGNSSLKRMNVKVVPACCLIAVWLLVDQSFMRSIAQRHLLTFQSMKLSRVLPVTQIPAHTTIKFGKCCFVTNLEAKVFLRPYLSNWQSFGRILDEMNCKNPLIW